MADSSLGPAAKLRCELSDLAAEFATSLRATNHSPATVARYGEFIRQLIVFLDRRGPTTAAGVHREHVEAYLVEVGEERELLEGGERRPGGGRLPGAPSAPYVE